MADSSTLPGLRSWPQMPPEWWRFFRELSTTTTTATVDLSGYLPTTTAVNGSSTIQASGTLGSGAVRFDLRPLADAAGGTFQLFTRDTYGRISQSAAGDAADVPVDDSGWTEISGATAQAAFTSTDTELALKAPLASPTLATPSLSGLGNYADDTAAGAGGVPVGGVYRNGSALQIRVT